MTSRVTTKLVRAGEYAAEVEVELIAGDAGWPPYLSVKELISWMYNLAVRIRHITPCPRLRAIAVRGH